MAIAFLLVLLLINDLFSIKRIDHSINFTAMSRREFQKIFSRPRGQAFMQE